MALTGHDSAIYSMAFSNNGKYVVSGSLDRSLLLWNVYDTTCSNYGILKGHKNGILQVQWSSDDA